MLSRMKLATAITRLLNIDHPILLAPMGGVAGVALAREVSAGGGLGLIGAGYADPAFGYGSDEWIRGEFDKAGDHAVGIGFITWALEERPGALDAALECKPRAVMLSFGDIEPYAAKIREAGATLICQVQTLKDAREAAAKGAQIIIAQGTEAGGHGADRATLPLVPAVVDAVAPIPVAAAGGISDGRGLAAALMPGRRSRSDWHPFLRHEGGAGPSEPEGADRANRRRPHVANKGVRHGTGHRLAGALHRARDPQRIRRNLARPRRRTARAEPLHARALLRGPARRGHGDGGYLCR